MSKFHFFFNILSEIPHYCVALLELRFCISLENSYLASNFEENVQFESLIMFLMFMIQGCLENFSWN